MMVISEIAESLREVKDNLGKRDSTTEKVLKYNAEKVMIEENTTTIKAHIIGHSFILGHSLNGKLGVTNGSDGEQVVLGEAGRSYILVRVVNPDDTFREHFRDTTFLDTAQDNTANWDTTNFRLAMSSETSKTKAYNTIAHSSVIYLEDGAEFTNYVTKATVNATETKFGNDEIRYFLSNDDSDNWYEATRGVELSFPSAGKKLRFRVVFIGNGGADTYIEDLNIAYRKLF